MSTRTGTPRPLILALLVCLVLTFVANSRHAPAGAAPVAPTAPVTAAPADPQSGQAFDQLQSGRRVFIQGRWKEALPPLEKAVKLNPNLGDAWYLLGLTCMQLNLPDRAEKAFLQVVRIDNRSYNGWMQAAGAALAQGEYERARKHCRSIFDYDRKSFVGWYALGVVEYKAGRLGDAIYAFNQSRAYWDDYPPTNYNLGVCYYDQRSAPRGMVCLRKATVREPKKALYSFTLGWVAYMTNDFSTAFLALNKAITEDKTGVYGPTAQALMCMRQRKYDEAGKLLDMALKKDPEMVKAMVLKALLLLQQNKRDDAVAILKESLEVDPLDIDARDTLMRLGVTPPPPGPARLPGKKPVAPTPSATPSAAPSAMPSGSPSGAPSGTPSGSPSGAPVTQPSAAPSAVPAASPSPAPSPRKPIPAPPGVPVPR